MGMSLFVAYLQLQVMGIALCDFPSLNLQQSDKKLAQLQALITQHKPWSRL